MHSKENRECLDCERFKDSVLRTHYFNIWEKHIQKNTDICIYWGTKDEEEAVYSLRILLLLLTWELISSMVGLHWGRPAIYLATASRNPGRNVTVHLCLITMEGDKLTLTY